MLNAIRLSLIQNTLWPPCAHTHTHTMSSFLWADLTALALGLVELHPANPCCSATGAIPMESQTFQAFAKAGPTGISSALYTLTLTATNKTACCSFTTRLIRPAGKCFFLSTLSSHTQFLLQMFYWFILSFFMLIFFIQITSVFFSFFFFVQCKNAADHKIHVSNFITVWVLDQIFFWIVYFIIIILFKVF